MDLFLRTSHTPKQRAYSLFRPAHSARLDDSVLEHQGRSTVTSVDPFISEPRTALPSLFDPWDVRLRSNETRAASWLGVPHEQLITVSTLCDSAGGVAALETPVQESKKTSTYSSIGNLVDSVESVRAKSMKAISPERRNVQRNSDNQSASSPPTCPEMPILVKHHHRVESLIHAELVDYALKLRQCPRVQHIHKSHGEWFEVDQQYAVEVIRKWSEWANSSPYEERCFDDMHPPPLPKVKKADPKLKKANPKVKKAIPKAKKSNLRVKIPKAARTTYWRLRNPEIYFKRNLLAR